MYSLKILSVSVARRPFRVGTKVYYPGDVITDPGSIPFFATKRREGKIVELTEHNLQDVAQYIEYRQGVKDAKVKLTKALKGTSSPKKVDEDKYSDPAYVKKVTALAKKKGVSMEGKTIQEVVEELKAADKG